MSELFLGDFAPIYASTCIVIIVLMILCMSLRLYLTGKRKGYFMLTVSLVFLIVQYFLSIGLHLDRNLMSDGAQFGLGLLQTISFILTQAALFQLYNSTKVRHILYFAAALVATACSAGLYFYVPATFNGTEAQMNLLRYIGHDLYLLLLILLSFYFITPAIGQARKYQLGLLLYFIVQTAHTIHVYILTEPSVFLQAVEHFLPIGYFALLFLIVFERIVELMQDVYRSSITDSLTGLYNRHYFDQQLARHIREETPVAVIFGDIDNFKQWNDTKGHRSGDEILQRVAAIFVGVSEEIGEAARYGGEELVLLITDPSVSAKDVAERIRRRVETETPVTISIGYCTANGKMKAAQLLEKADRAMYKAKSTGKNRIAGCAASK